MILRRRQFIYAYALILVAGIWTVATFYQDIQHLLNKVNKKQVAVHHPWSSGCPTADHGTDGFIVTTDTQGRLGNLVWEYLSVWAVARRHGMWPALPGATLEQLGAVLEPRSLHVPALEDVAARCGLPWLQQETHRVPQTFSNAELFQLIENPERGVTVVALSNYAVVTELLVHYWKEIVSEIKLQSSLILYAQNVLHKISNEIYRENKENDKPTAVLEFVGVHVRRTDYAEHVRLLHPGASVADGRFFRSAMQWLRDTLHHPLAFIVTSDDIEWCNNQLHAPDVFIVGNGKLSEPGQDLALLSSCNHTIFAYGTFGLTASLISNSKYTLIYNTQNNTNTKEMEFAYFLPGWIILDDNGDILNRDIQFKFTYIKTRIDSEHLKILKRMSELMRKSRRRV